MPITSQHVACVAFGFTAGCCWFALLSRRRRAPAAPPSAAAAPPAAPLLFHTTVAHRVHSPAGLPYKLLVSLPLQYAESKEQHPVLYVLDAEPYLFPLVATAARTNHFFRRTSWYPDAIVVGITADLEPAGGPAGGAAVRALWDALRSTRARDYLPTAAESPWGAPGAEPLLHVSGHAKTFVGVLTGVVVPFVEERYRAAPGQRALMGKSFGGSGVAAALTSAEASQTFQYYILGSPSLAWDNGAWFREEEATRGEVRLEHAAVYIARGGAESPGMLDTVREFALRCRQRGVQVCQVDIPEGEDHGSLSYPFACRSLNWLAAQLARTRE